MSGRGLPAAVEVVGHYVDEVHGSGGRGCLFTVLSFLQANCSRCIMLWYRESATGLTPSLDRNVVLPVDLTATVVNGSMSYSDS